LERSGKNLPKIPLAFWPIDPTMEPRTPFPDSTCQVKGVNTRGEFHS